MASKVLRRVIAKAVKDANRLYPSSKMRRMRRELARPSYGLIGQGRQHKVYLGSGTGRVVKTTKSEKEVLAPLKKAARRAGMSVDRREESSAWKIIAQAVSSYGPVKEWGGQYVWPMDLLTEASFTVEGRRLRSAVAVVQKQFIAGGNGTSCQAVIESATDVEALDVFNAYLGTLYNLARQGVFVKDWINFDNAVLPTPGILESATDIVFIDPFNCISRKSVLEGDFRACVETELGVLGMEAMLKGREREFRLFSQSVILFLRSYDFVRNFGVDKAHAQRVPGCFQ